MNEGINAIWAGYLVGVWLNQLVLVLRRAVARDRLRFQLSTAKVDRVCTWDFNVLIRSFVRILQHATGSSVVLHENTTVAH